MRFRYFALFLAPWALAAPSRGQETMPPSMSMSMPSDEPMSMDMMKGPAVDFEQKIFRHDTSGTSAESNSTPVPMLMKHAGGWMLMFHGNGFLVEEQQTSPRGRDKLFSTNWMMPMAQRHLGPGVLTLRSMLSFEPGTITGREYPLLFQQGETAFGKPIVDGQHPHNFFMELGLLYDWRLRPKTMLSIYVAPVGDPAIGPTAYPHRISAAQNPVAALGHHQEDSTHIADDVITVGLTQGIVRLEASGFHGREPNEHRWLIQQGTIDSWSARLTVQPGKNWSGQYSFAELHSVEALYPTEDQRRMTASAMYNRPLRSGNWANTVVWGRTHSPQGGSTFNSYLAESALLFSRRNTVWVRIENTDRSDELLTDATAPAAGAEERAIGRVQAYTFGYERQVGRLPLVGTALGAQVTAYGVPSALRGSYGSNPAGFTVFFRVWPRTR